MEYKGGNTVHCEIIFIRICYVRIYNIHINGMNEGYLRSIREGGLYTLWIKDDGRGWSYTRFQFAIELLYNSTLGFGIEYTVNCWMLEITHFY